MNRKPCKTELSRALGLLCLALASGSALAQEAAPAAAAPANEEAVELDAVTVRGFRQSLQYSTEAKRDSTGFTDSIFSEDIGKFPDTNIAESLARIPGIQLNRDVNGEGTNIAIRGLPSSFTKTTINGASVATASIGLDATNQNREVDLNMFPTEFFNQITVYKSPVASLPEGGASGVVDMRNMRPFDISGNHVTYSLQADYNDNSKKASPRGSVIANWNSEDGRFGALVGLTSTRGKLGVEGYETIGWTNPNLTNDQCLGNGDQAGFPSLGQPCNVTGGNGWRIPNTVPGTAIGLTPGETIDAEWLLANNPGLTTAQIGEALIPRLGRPVHMSGDRDRDGFLGSFQWRPNDSMEFRLDTLYTKAHRTNSRVDMNLIGRNGQMIPQNMQLDENNVVTRADFTNAQFFLEHREYIEDVQYWQINPGATFWFGDDQNVKLDVQASTSRSWMFRESPTILVNSPFTTLEYTNSGDTPTWNTPLDLNDPNLGWTWAGGRLNVQNEKRVTETSGFRADLQLGEDRNNIKLGVAWDQNQRRIQGFDNSGAWEDLVCRGLNADGSTPDPRPACNGGGTALLSDAALAGYLRRGPHGFIVVDADRFKNDTNYAFYRDTAPESGGPNTGGATGGFDEETFAAYVEVNGETEVLDRNVRFNVGMRYVQTDQEVAGPVTIGEVRQWQSLTGDYSEWLPSFSAAWDVADNVVLRMSGSRTMTRPNPSSMLPATTFTDMSAQVANQGNPDLTPYISTNFDLGGEWYTGGEGFVGLTLFNKRVEGYTFQGVTTRPFRSLGIPFEDLDPTQQVALNNRGGPDVATVNVQQQVNADAELEIRGWEAIWVQPLSFVLQGLGFMANYTDLDIKTLGKDASALSGNVYGVAPSMWNATTYWENDVASVRLSYTWAEGAAGTGPNQQGIPFAQIYGEDRGQLDLSASYTLKNIRSQPQLTFNVLNLTGEERRSYFAFPNAVNDMYDPGRTVTVGIRGTF
ncbi:TonB-dependent receptor [Pseudoxanthomonas suwonensis 11-1]|uniref:TonB-dependent receptor n=1 Tax=Pseudoxanthomonas suwonensis (strain 11-1) TaxID=743721 RepID=E6WX33_PSEUU|nr:TonB-dependent receptor [Pseudoxanthomonas suwonensis]ADV28732.1 TonB-dependent receptor [Pseudoxanthomonas suwonensis 11-1]